MHTSKNSQPLHWGGAHSRVEAYIANQPLPPYVGKQLLALFHTQLRFSVLGAVYMQLGKAYKSRRYGLETQGFRVPFVLCIMSF